MAVTPPVMPTTVVLSDSRGVSLGVALNDITHGEIKSLSFPGASFTELIFRSADVIKRYKPKLVVILGGINDLTLLDKTTRKVSVRFDSVHKCCDHFTDIIINARALLNREYPDVLFTFGGIVGIDLSKYNRCESRPEDQELINESILEVNRLLRHYNYHFNAPHEYFTSLVHRWVNGRCQHNYDLLYDGLQPRFPVLRHWIKQIFKLHAKIGGTVFNV